LQECENIGSGRTSYVRQLANDLIQSWHASDMPADSSSSSSDSDLESVDSDGSGNESGADAETPVSAVEPKDMTKEQQAEEAETQKTLNSLLELGELLGDQGDKNADDCDDLEAFTEDEAEPILSSEDLISKAFSEAASRENRPSQDRIAAWKTSEDKAFADIDSTIEVRSGKKWEETPTSSAGEDTVVQADLSGSDTCSSDEEDPLALPMNLPSTFHLLQWDGYTPMTCHARDAVDVLL